MENAALTSHQTVSAISASEANEIGLYSGDVISLSVEKKESLSTANSAMAMADGVQSQKRVRSAVRGRQKIFFRSEWLDAPGVSVVM